MLREDEKLYDFVVVTREGRYLGVVTVKELLEKSIELEVANARSAQSAFRTAGQRPHRY